MPTYDTQGFWEPVCIDIDTCYHWAIGPLDLWVRRDSHEWSVASRRDPQEEEDRSSAGPAAFPKDLDYRRWNAGVLGNEISLKPVFPDRPVVIRPEQKITLLPKDEAVYFAGVPFWIQVTAGTDPGRVLCEEKTSVMNNTWFGSPTEGQLCYSLQTWASRDPGRLAPRPFRAVCPIRIRNNSTTALEFERLCLRVDYLNIYAGERQLWSNECRVSYVSEEKTSEVDYDKDPPKFEKTINLVGPSRNTLGSGGIIARTFHSIRSFTNT